jgi:hypothetical protein
MDELIGNIMIKPSKVCDGVGIFPIIQFNKGDTVLNYTEERYPRSFNITSLHSKKIKYLQSIWGIEDSIPNTVMFHPVNFLNHSNNPNVIYDERTGNYIATRIIKPSQEITINYKGYNDLILKKIKTKKNVKSKRKKPIYNRRTNKH